MTSEHQAATASADFDIAIIGMGPGFAVVARDANSLQMNPASEAVLDRLSARRVTLDGLDDLIAQLARLLHLT